MIAHRRSNYWVCAIGLFSTGVAWSAPPPASERNVVRKSAGATTTAADELQAVDQEGNLVTLPPSVTTAEVETATQPRFDLAEPARAAQDGPAASANTAEEPGDGTPSTPQAPILDPASSQFSFQALLTDASGDPLPDGTVELLFNLYDDLGTLVHGPIGPFIVPIANGIVDTQVPIVPKFFDGSARELGVTVDRGVELIPRVKLVAVPYALRVDRVRSAELDDTIDLGAIDANGELRVWNNLANARTVILSGSKHSVTVFGANGTSNATLGGESFGELSLRDLTGNNQTASLSATANSGGELSLSGATGDFNIFADGGTGTIDATNGFRIATAIPGDVLMRMFSFADGAQMVFNDEFGVAALQGGTSAQAGGMMFFNQADGGVGVRVLGDAGTNAGGSVTAYDAASNPTIRLDGNRHLIEFSADNGEERAQLVGSSWGELSLFDGNGFLGTAPSDRTVRLSAGPNLLSSPGPGNEFGGTLSLADSTGTTSIYLGGSTANLYTTGGFQVLSTIAAVNTNLAALEAGTNGGVLFLSQGNGTRTVELDGDAGTNAGADLLMRASTGTATIFIDADSGDAGLVQVRNATGSTKISLDGADANGGGVVTLHASDGSTTVRLLGESGAAGLIQVNDAVSLTRIELDGSSTGTGGEIRVFDGNGTETIELLGDEAALGAGSAQILLRNSTGSQRIELDADTGSGSRIQMFTIDGGTGVVMDSDVNGGGRIRVRNAANSSRIFIDGDFAGTGLSRIRADVFRVQGGVDLAEPFECKDNERVKSGMVMSIDPNSPGKLMISTEAYDRKVAGIISGAGGVRPGITLSQEGVMDEGHLVALTGRVYCMVDTSNGAIVPGDLLTTSSTPGHAMKVRDYGKAQGAILGKAMTPLTTGTGLVLVLVQPQ